MYISSACKKIKEKVKKDSLLPSAIVNYDRLLAYVPLSALKDLNFHITT